MAIANATYTIRKVYKRPILHSTSKFVGVSEVTVAPQSGDTYVTAGITPSASSCGLVNISAIHVLGVLSDSTHGCVGIQTTWPAVGSDPKIMLLAADNSEMTNATSLVGYTLILQVEGHI